MQRLIGYIIVLFVLSQLPVRPAASQHDNTKLLQDIRNAYEGLDFTVAEARINAALEDYNRFKPAELSDIHAIYALIYFARNDLPSARSQLEQALQLTPTMTMNAAETPPQLLQIFNDIKEELAAQTSAQTTPAQVRYLVVYDPRPAAVMRSMIVPGWGQLYKGERKKGWMLIGLWGATAGGSLVAHINRARAEDRYLAAVTQQQIQDRFVPFDTWHKVRNNLFLGAVGVWAFSYLDAILQGEPTPPQINPDPPLQFSVQPGDTSPRFHVKWRF